MSIGLLDFVTHGPDLPLVFHPPRVGVGQACTADGRVHFGRGLLAELVVMLAGIAICVCRRTRNQRIVLTGCAVAGWALCGAVMGIGLSLTTLENTLMIRAVAASLIFGAQSLRLAHLAQQRERDR